MAGRHFNTRERWARLTGCLLLALLIAAPPAAADEAQWSGDPIGFDGPYCGLYALYGAARINGMAPSPDGIRPLLKPQYIGSRAGASTTELEAAADALGMHARTFNGMTRLDLMALASPAILHVKSHPANEFFDHWILVVSCDATGALVIDESSTPIREPIDSLTGRWDGTAIVVSRETVPATVRLPTALAASAAILALLAGAGLVRWLPAKLVGARGHGSRFVRAGAMAGFVLVIALVSAGLDRNQAIWDTDGRQAVIDRHLEQFLPPASLEQVRAWSGGGDAGVIIVDSRSSEDFAAGHIPGARSVPVWAPDKALAALVEELGEDKRLVIYCQSSQCSFSGMLAARLRHMGFERTSIYHEGWAGWQEAARATAPAAGDK
jgi:rhodanese-related sulfurtransferase